MERRRDNAAIPKNADWVLHIGVVIVFEDGIVAEELPPYSGTSNLTNHTYHFPCHAIGHY